MLQFACTYLARRHCNSVFSKTLLIVISWLVQNGIVQIFFTQDTLYQKQHWHNLCVHNLIGGAEILFFQNFFLIFISRILLYGIAQNFIWNIRTARNDNDIISMIVPHQRQLQLRFFENCCDSHNLASLAWNNTKLNMGCTYYKTVSRQTKIYQPLETLNIC